MTTPKILGRQISPEHKIHSDTLIKAPLAEAAIKAHATAPDLLLPSVEGPQQLAGMLFALWKLKENSVIQSGDFAAELKLSLTEKREILHKLQQAQIIDAAGRVAPDAAAKMVNPETCYALLYQNPGETGKFQAIAFNENQCAHKDPAGSPLNNEAQRWLKKLHGQMMQNPAVVGAAKTYHFADTSRDPRARVALKDIKTNQYAEAAAGIFALWKAEGLQTLASEGNLAKHRPERGELLEALNKTKIAELSTAPDLQDFARRHNVLYINNPAAQNQRDWQAYVKNCETAVQHIQAYARDPAAPGVLHSIAEKISHTAMVLKAEQEYGQFGATFKTNNQEVKVRRDIYEQGKVLGYECSDAENSSDAVRHIARMAFLEHVTAALGNGKSMQEIMMGSLSIDLYYIKSELTDAEVVKIFQEEGFLNVNLRLGEHMNESMLAAPAPIPAAPARLSAEAHLVALIEKAQAALYEAMPGPAFDAAINVANQEFQSLEAYFGTYSVDDQTRFEQVKVAEVQEKHAYIHRNPDIYEDVFLELKAFLFSLNEATSPKHLEQLYAEKLPIIQAALIGYVGSNIAAEMQSTLLSAKNFILEKLQMQFYVAESIGQKSWTEIGKKYQDHLLDVVINFKLTPAEKAELVADLTELRAQKNKEFMDLYQQRLDKAKPNTIAKTISAAEASFNRLNISMVSEFRDQFNEATATGVQAYRDRNPKAMDKALIDCFKEYSKARGEADLGAIDRNMRDRLRKAYYTFLGDSAAVQALITAEVRKHCDAMCDVTRDKIEAVTQLKQSQPLEELYENRDRAVSSLTATLARIEVTLPAALVEAFMRPVYDAFDKRETDLFNVIALKKSHIEQWIAAIANPKTTRLVEAYQSAKSELDFLQSNELISPDEVDAYQDRMQTIIADRFQKFMVDFHYAAWEGLQPDELMTIDSYTDLVAQFGNEKGLQFSQLCKEGMLEEAALIEYFDAVAQYEFLHLKFPKIVAKYFSAQSPDELAAVDVECRVGLSAAEISYVNSVRDFVKEASAQEILNAPTLDELEEYARELQSELNDFCRVYHIPQAIRENFWHRVEQVVQTEKQVFTHAALNSAPYVSSSSDSDSADASDAEEKSTAPVPSDTSSETSSTAEEVPVAPKRSPSWTASRTSYVPAVETSRDLLPAEETTTASTAPTPTSVKPPQQPSILDMNEEELASALQPPPVVPPTPEPVETAPVEMELEAADPASTFNRLLAGDDELALGAEEVHEIELEAAPPAASIGAELASEDSAKEEIDAEYQQIEKALRTDIPTLVKTISEWRKADGANLVGLADFKTAVSTLLEVAQDPQSKISPPQKAQLIAELKNAAQKCVQLHGRLGKQLANRDLPEATRARGLSTGAKLRAIIQEIDQIQTALSPQSPAPVAQSWRAKVKAFLSPASSAPKPREDDAPRSAPPSPGRK